MSWADFFGRFDDGGEVSAVVDLSAGDALAGDPYAGVARLELAVWEQWL
ncbi:hypothetical protein ACQR35_00220 [Pseudarthrobacter sp. J1738]